MTLFHFALPALIAGLTGLVAEASTRDLSHVTIVQRLFKKGRFLVQTRKALSVSRAVSGPSRDFTAL